MRQLLMMITATMILATPTVFAKSAQPEYKLKKVITDTIWQWCGPSEQIVFKKNGYVGNPNWEGRNLVTSWKVIDEHTVLLILEEGRKTDRYAILVFNDDMTEYTGYNFTKTSKIIPSKQVKK